jgi:transposase
MEPIPDLDKLSVAEKDALIRELWPLRTLARELSEQLTALQAKVTELEARLALNSRNSSKPPSSDGLNKPKPKSLRQRGERPTGGQKEHAGHTLEKVAEPDQVVEHAPPSFCPACQAPLPAGTVIEARQVFDLPALVFEVTEHRVLAAHCTCGKLCRGEFPAGVTAPVQYGPAELAHADETGLRIAGSLHWMHVLATELMTWVGCHAKRGRAAFDAFAILPNFQGTLIHDGWKPYRELPCRHGLCNAHHLRELTYVYEELGQAWAGGLIELLQAANQAVKQQGGPLPAAQLAVWRAQYEDILCEGETLNPVLPKSGKRGRTRQSKATNLLLRLRSYADDVWRFATDHNVPFTNNLAEQAVRMPKVKQKISGGFRTQNGAETFCTIRSYMATLHKQGHNLFHALTQTFQNVFTIPHGCVKIPGCVPKDTPATSPGNNFW